MTILAPYQPGSDTSREAAISIEKDLCRLERAVFTAIRSRGEAGANCWEVERMTGISRACSSARLNRLRMLGIIYDTGLRRETDSGRNAVVYRIKGDI